MDFNYEALARLKGEFGAVAMDKLISTMKLHGKGVAKERRGGGMN